MADIEADPNQSSLDGESGVTNKEKLADSTTQDSSSSDGKNEDTNGVVVSSTSSFGSSQNSSGVSSTQTLSSPLIPPSRLTFCRPTPSLAGLGASKMMPNPFAPKGSLKSDMVSSASVSTPSSEGILTPSRFGLSRQPGPDSTNVKSAGFKSGPLLAPSKFGVQSTQNIHSLIKPATLPDPTNKTSVDKEQTEKSDADSSSSNPTSEASKEVISSDNTTATNQLEVGNISSTTAPSHNDSNSPSKFTPPAFSRLSENNENKVTSLAGGKDSTDGAAVSSTPSSNSKEFVFGTNLHQRVVGFDDNSKKNNNCSGFVFGEKIGGRAMAAEKTPSPPPSDHRLENSSEETNTPNFKSVAFKPGPLLTPSRFSVQSTQNIHSLIKPATLPDPTNKTSVDKEQTEKSDADSSSSNPTSEASKEVISSDNTTATNQLEVGNISSTTAPSHNDSNSPSKFTPPAFSRLSENNENKVTSLAGGKDSTDGAAVSSTPSSNSKEFVFGTNLHQRVVGFDDNSKKNNNCSGFVFGEKIGGRAMAAEKTPSPPPSDHRLANSSEETNTPNFKSVAFKPGPLLTPSRFSIQSSQNVHNLIKPATLPDPTNKEQSEKSDADSSSKPLSEASDHTSTNNSRLEAGSISSTTATGQNNSNSPKFTPPAFSSSNIPNTSSLGVKDSTDIGSVSSTPSSSRGEFLFGTNLHQRVVGIEDNSKKNNNCSGFVFGENLANRVVAAEKTSSPSSSEPCLTNSADEINTPEKQCQSLEESAREYQAKHGVRPEYKEIEVKTGEEDESNVLQCNCKLFVFDKPTQMWIERGCGVLRLNDLAGNDSEKFQSRIVMRSQGSLRVILNTKIWTGMTVERASQKTVRITAADGDGVKVFLIAANPKDIDNIFRAIDWRIQQLKTEEEEEEEEKRGGTEKRKSESQDWISPNKKLKKLSELSTSTSSGESKSVPKEESDSSVLDPETEASNESYTSSQTVRSESD